MKIEIRKIDKGTRLVLSGRITEDSDFSTMPTSAQVPLFVDMQNITKINSCGLRYWIIWMNSMGAGAKILLENCPQGVVDQVNILEGFMGGGTIVQSFYVPYYCEDCEEGESIFKKRGIDFTSENIEDSIINWELNPPKCPQCMSGMELDAISGKYFNFLR